LRIQSGFDPKNSWTIRKRYREFSELYDQIKPYNLPDLKLPPKKLFGNMNKEFISDRQIGLQVKYGVVVSLLILRIFEWFRRTSWPEYSPTI
jgi:PX domain-containing protein kinase-like protein